MTKNKVKSVEHTRRLCWCSIHYCDIPLHHLFKKFLWNLTWPFFFPIQELTHATQCHQGDSVINCGRCARQKGGILIRCRRKGLDSGMTWSFTAVQTGEGQLRWHNQRLQLRKLDLLLIFMSESDMTSRPLRICWHVTVHNNIKNMLTTGKHIFNL